MLRIFYRYVLPVLLPTVSAAASAIAGATGYPERVYWTLAAVAFIAGSAIITTLSTRQADSAKRAAVNAKADLGAALTGAGQPLVVALANLSSAPAEQQGASLAILKSRIVEIAKVQCGQDAPGRPSQRVRACFYEFSDEKRDRLRHNGHFEGRGGVAPRDEFGYMQPHEKSVVNFARGRNALLVKNIDKDAPEEFEKAGRSFRSFIATPVRAGNGSFGVLSVDSEIEDAFSKLDVGYLQLLAGLLASGISVASPLPAPQESDNGNESTTGGKDGDC